MMQKHGTSVQRVYVAKSHGFNSFPQDGDFTQKGKSINLLA